MREYDAYLFDFDNTIADSSYGLQLALKTAFKEYGIPYDPDRYHVYITTPLEDTFRKYYPDSPCKFRDFYSIVITTYDKYHKDCVMLFPDAESAIRELYKRGKDLAVVSNSMTSHIRTILTNLNVINMFGSIVGADRCRMPKPDPAPVLLALDELSVEPRNAVMVGDGPNDALAGVRAGCDAVFIDRRHSGNVYDGAETICDMKELLTPFRLS